jgi:hypothetical protein
VGGFVFAIVEVVLGVEGREMRCRKMGEWSEN